MCRRVLQPWHGLRIGSLQAEKLCVREEVHDSFPHAHGIYVQKVTIHLMFSIFFHCVAVLFICVLVIVHLQCMWYQLQKK